jgi:hypothetical protein
MNVIVHILFKDEVPTLAVLVPRLMVSFSFCYRQGLSDSSVKLILLLVVEVEKFTKESELNSLFHGGLEPPNPSLTKGSPRHGVTTKKDCRESPSEGNKQKLIILKCDGNKLVL